MSEIISSSDEGNDVVVPNTESSIPAGDDNQSGGSGFKRYTIRRRFGRYRIMDCVGRGGMGMVFKAQDTELGRVIALKVPFLGEDDADTRERFYREARTAATIQHAYICPVFDVGEIGGVPYLTMAFIDGRSLAQSLADGQVFAPVQAALLLRELALAMQEAHAHGVIHRDLKPGNVLVRANGDPVVMDFGLARRCGDTRTRGLTQQGDILGTVDYMSPEQVEGEAATVGPAADVYALGVILYELLTGRRPFTGSSAMVLAATLVKPPPRPSELRPGVPAKLEEICLTALNKKPEDRFTTMAQFAAALAEFLRSPQQSAAQALASPPPVEPARPETDHPDAPSRARFSPSGLKSARKRSRSVTRRKAKAKHRSYVPMILGVAALMVVAVGGLAGAAIGLWPHGSKNVNVAAPTVAAAPAMPRPAAPTPAPTIVTPPVAPAPNPPPVSNPNPPVAPKPRGTGFALRSEPESVRLTVGQPERLTLKIVREDYQGPVSLRWDGPKDVRVSPPGPVTVAPDQSEVNLNLWVLEEPPAADLRLNVTASPAQDPGRGTVTSHVAVTVAPGPCLRVVEIGGRSNVTIEAMAFAPDTSWVLVGGGGAGQQGAAGNPGNDRNAILVCNLDRGDVMSKLSGHGDRVTGLEVSANGKTALSVSADGTIAVWDLVQGRRKQQSVKAQGLHVLTAAMSPDAKRGLVAYTGAIVKVNLDTLQPISPPVKSVALAGTSLPDGFRVAAVSAERKALLGGIDGKLVLLDLSEKGKTHGPKPLAGHTEAVLCAAFSQSGKAAATAGGGVWQAGGFQRGTDNAVRLWDVAGPAIKWTSDSLPDAVVSVAFSPDGQFLAAGTTDGEIRVWAVSDGNPVAAFKGHKGRVLGLAFAPQGKPLWSGSADQTVRAWRLP